jgi:hydroxymethylpyrimidine/phosphomethylpyrimidine kinase
MIAASVLSVGTTEPRNVAGVGRDIVVGAELGCSVAVAVAAVSAQDDTGVHALHVVPAAIVRAQIERVSPDVVRIGALGNAQNVSVLARWLERHPVPAVVDPVASASAGGALVEPAVVRAVFERLASLPNVILTPNLPEAAALLSRARIDDPAAAAAELRARGARAVLLKGGHGTGDPTDVLATVEGVEAFTAPRIGATMPGSGCTLAMAIACGLARRLPLRDAVVSAREYVRAKMFVRGSLDVAQRNAASQ